MNSYDYVVVGGGMAGCVVAARLSEDPAARVLLLEAGPADPAEAGTADWPALSGGALDWGDATVPQQGTAWLEHTWPRGRVLGGSGAIGGPAFARGDGAVYDGWAAGGATGWSAHELLPYFKRGETATHGDPATRGRSGPLTVAPVPAARRHPISRAFCHAVVEAGFPGTRDASGAEPYGVGWYDMTTGPRGERRTTADAYLRPHLDERPNLTVTTGASVRRLLVDRGRCVGVGFVADGRVQLVRVGTEVVLCAGTIGSPHLLMLSGIGPARHLAAHGIRVLAALPGVGENLHDRLETGAVYAIAGPMLRAATQVEEIGALLRSDPGLNHPDVRIHPVPAPFSPALEPSPAHGFTLTAALASVHSRGTVRLASADPGRAPLIDPRYLADARDVDTLVAGLRLARRIGEAGAFKAWRAAELVPGELGSVAAWREFVRLTASTQHHPVGTCRIGTDDFAVVDPLLRVHGVAGLRVADASVMPSIPSSHPAATVIAIAERAAALIAGERLEAAWRAPHASTGEGERATRG